MKKTLYILAVMILICSCVDKNILTSIPKFSELENQSFLADDDLLSAKISYRDYLIIKSIQNSINHGTIHFVNGLTYSQILHKVSNYKEGEGFYSSSYQGTDFINFGIDTIAIDEEVLKMNINLKNETTESIYIEEIILLVEDIVGKELFINIYSCPIEIETNKDTIFGAEIDKAQIMNSFYRRNFKIKIAEELFDHLDFKAIANKIESKSIYETPPLEYYRKPDCSSSRIVNEYIPEQQLQKYSKNDTLKERIIFVDKLTCK